MVDDRHSRLNVFLKILRESNWVAVKGKPRKSKKKKANSKTGKRHGKHI